MGHRSPVYGFQNGTKFHLKILIYFVYLTPLNTATTSGLSHHQQKRKQENLPHESVTSFLHPCPSCFCWRCGDVFSTDSGCPAWRTDAHSLLDRLCTVVAILEIVTTLQMYFSALRAG